MLSRHRGFLLPGSAVIYPHASSRASPSPMPPKTRHRRTEAERIAALQAEIERIKARAAEQKARKDPALRHISGALRAIDKAATATRDAATRTALNESRATLALAACMALNGAVPAMGGVKRTAKPRGSAPDAEKVLAYIKKHPGSRSEELCEEFGTDALSLRPVLHELRDDGKLKVEGKARATRYSVS